MRILRIDDVPNDCLGGMSRAIHATSNALRAMGHEVDCLFDKDLYVLGHMALRRFLVPLKIPLLVRRRVRSGQPYDVVSIHEPLAAPYCWLGRRWKDLPPVVVYSYGLEERGHQALLDYRRKKGLPIGLKERYSPLTVVWQAKYAVRHAHHTICFNSADFAALRQAGIPAERITVHNSGVEPAFLSADPQWESRDPAGLLFVATWILRKGILDLAPAVTEVMRRRGQTRLTIACCAVKEEVVLDQFPADIRSRIQVIPFVRTNLELIDIYRRHSIFVLPSVFEGQPLTLIESAALGLAIVTTNVCGMPDFITHQENGLLVEVGDTGALVRRLDELLNSPALVSKLGEAARARAQQFTWTRSAEKIAAAFAAAIKSAS
jgi:glycosyltransferase involved in cell wall biosynthesis